jgi:hypothetical protein
LIINNCDSDRKLSIINYQLSIKKMEAYIIDGVRTPIGSYQGTLSSVRPDDLGALVIKSVVEKIPTYQKMLTMMSSWVALIKLVKTIVM